MIELNGLTYANRATCPAESVAPELWPYWATLPCLGSFGNDLVDACNKQNLAASDVKAWSPHGMVFSGSNVAQSYTLPEIDYYSGFSVVSVASPSQDSSDNVLAGAWGTNDYHEDWIIWYDVGGAAKGWSAAIADSGLYGYHKYRIVGNDTLSGNLNMQSTICMAIVGTEIQLNVDGSMIPYSRYDSPFASRITSTPRIGRDDMTTPRLLTGCVSMFSLYDRAITIDESAILSSDPLLPFRRRKLRTWFPALAAFRPWMRRRMEVVQ